MPKKGQKMPRWTERDVRYLTQHYANRPNLTLAIFLDRPVRAVVSKAHHLGLKKSDEYLSRMGRANVRQRKDRQ